MGKDDLTLENGQTAKKKGKRKKKKKTALWIILILLILAIAAGGGFLLWKHLQPQSKYDLDRNALEGFLPGKTQAEIEAELNRIIEESYMNVSMNPTLTLRNGKLNVAIENVPANHYYQQVDIYIYPEDGNQDKQELIYQSGILKQGFYIGEGDVLGSVKNKIKKGQYNGIAVIHGLEPDTLEEIGQTSMTLVVDVL